MTGEYHGSDVIGLSCRMPPQDVVIDSGEMLEAEYIIAPGAAIMLEAAPRAAPPTPQSRAASMQASQVYQRMGQPSTQ